MCTEVCTEEFTKECTEECRSVKRSLNFKGTYKVQNVEKYLVEYI